MMTMMMATRFTSEEYTSECVLTRLVSKRADSIFATNSHFRRFKYTKRSSAKSVTSEDLCPDRFPGFG